MPEEPDINKFLAELAIAVSKGSYIKLKEKFLEVWAKNKSKKDFGFTPSPERAKEIYQIGLSKSFDTLKEIVGKDHWALNLIKVGIHLAELSDKGERELVDKIRAESHKNKGRTALSVVNLGSTGAINGIIKYLDNLRTKGFLIEALLEEFDRILTEWEQITIFVKKDTDQLTVRAAITDKITRKLPIFFIFSYGALASDSAMKSIAELNNANQLRPNGYDWDAYPQFDGVGTQIYMWTFERYN